MKYKLWIGIVALCVGLCVVFENKMHLCSAAALHVRSWFGKGKHGAAHVPPSQRAERVEYLVHDELMPQGLEGISNEQIQDHWQLYKGYVAKVNELARELGDLAARGQGASLLYADRRRRYGFEYNGMVLHEYYFGNLKAGAEPLKKTSALYKTLEKNFGSYDAWKADFEAAGKTRGIGWAILYVDPATGALTNHFIAEHGNGNIAGFVPILVLDVWEHAYMVDHKAGGRGEYIASFMKNINWEKVEERYDAACAGKVILRF